MPGDARQSLGKLGEDLACAELRRRGYAILARRYRTRFGEIDIIARDGDDDRVRRGEGAGGTTSSAAAGAAVTAWKQRRIAQMAVDYPGAPPPARPPVPLRRGRRSTSRTAARASRCTLTRLPRDVAPNVTGREARDPRRAGSPADATSCETCIDVRTAQRSRHRPLGHHLHRAPQASHRFPARVGAHRARRLVSRSARGTSR